MKTIDIRGVGDQIWEALKKKKAIFLYRNFLNEDTGEEDDIIGVVSHFQRDGGDNITGIVRIFDEEIPKLLEIPNEATIGFRVSEEPTADLEFLLTPLVDPENNKG